MSYELISPDHSRAIIKTIYPEYHLPDSDLMTVDECLNSFVAGHGLTGGIMDMVCYLDSITVGENSERWDAITDVFRSHADQVKKSRDKKYPPRPDYDKYTAGMDPQELVIFDLAAESVTVPEKYGDMPYRTRELLEAGYGLDRLQWVESQGQEYGIADDKWRRS